MQLPLAASGKDEGPKSKAADQQPARSFHYPLIGLWRGRIVSLEACSSSVIDSRKTNLAEDVEVMA